MQEILQETLKIQWVRVPLKFLMIHIQNCSSLPYLSRIAIYGSQVYILRMIICQRTHGPCNKEWIEDALKKMLERNLQSLVGRILMVELKDWFDLLQT